MLGLCVTPNYFPTPEEEAELNPPFYRAILYSLDDARRLKAITNRPLIITLNNQCEEVGNDWSGWDNTLVQLWAILGSQLRVLGCGNEFDIYWKDNNNDVPPDFTADLARRAGRLLRPRGVKVAPTSVASEYWPDYLSSLSTLCRDDVDYFDIHPYGQRPTGFTPMDWGFGNLADCIQTAKNITGKPIICSEYGVKIVDAGDENRVADFLFNADATLNIIGDVQYASWFAYRDEIGATDERGQAAFGLMSEDGQKRPAWDTFVAINKGNTSVPDNVLLSYLSAWQGRVGHDILLMMQKDATEPAQRGSTWLPLGVTPSDIEECIGKNGKRYTWLLNENKGFVYIPEN